jgi:uncharacterized protein
MKFEIFAAKPIAGQKPRLAVFHYDNMTSELTNNEGSQIIDYNSKKNVEWEKALITDPANPLGKDVTNIKSIKLQMGLSCNYGCEYCSQRFVPHADNGNPKAVIKFMKNLDLWLKNIPEDIQFWGGEPLVYWKTLKPLAIALRKKFPNVKFDMVTNGSLLTSEINEFLDTMGFSIGMSHDGPGQIVRGPDPFKDPTQAANILDLWKRLGKERMSFNAMVHRENMDRAAIQKYFAEFLKTDDFYIGEGGFIDTYDAGGAENSIREGEQLGFRRLTIEQTRKSLTMNFKVTKTRVKEWIDAISNHRPADTLMQKCGMDRPDTIAVDLNGNVLTCHNTSAVAIAPNGKSHRIGHVSKMDDIKLTTSTHWSLRKNCSSCPMLQACKGSCMYLEDELWDKSCDNSYNDHLPYFAVTFELLTGGYMPYRINAAHLPEERQNIWGSADQESIIPKTRTVETKLAI